MLLAMYAFLWSYTRDSGCKQTGLMACHTLSNWLPHQRDILQNTSFISMVFILCNTLPKLANLTIPTSSSSTLIRVTCTTLPFLKKWSMTYILWQSPPYEPYPATPQFDPLCPVQAKLADKVA